MNYRKLQFEQIRKYKVYAFPGSSNNCYKRTHAHCDGSRTVCKHRFANSYNALFTLLHEIGHIETHKSTMKRCVSESEATIWAVNRMKELGLPLKRKILDKYRRYIKRTFDRGVRRGMIGSDKIKSTLFI